MIIDTHCHYNLEPLVVNWQQHWQTAQEKGVTAGVVVGTSLQTSQTAVEIARQQPRLLATVAIHPSEYQERLEANSASLEEIETQVTHEIAAFRTLADDQHLAAVGETGLDYFRLPAEPYLAAKVKSAQQLAFKQHIHLANELQLPLIVHVRDRETPETETSGNAYWDALSLIRQEYQPNQPFILHCLSGPYTYVQQALSLGAYVGIAANVTYRNADSLRHLVATAPPKRLLLETDAPFLPPQQYRGQVCEPWMIAETAKYLETELDIALSQLSENAAAVFPGLKA